MKVAPPPAYSSEDMIKMLEPKTYETKRTSSVATSRRRAFSTSGPSAYDDSIRLSVDGTRRPSADPTIGRPVVARDSSSTRTWPAGHDDRCRPAGNDGGGERVDDEAAWTAKDCTTSAGRRCGEGFASEVDPSRRTVVNACVGSDRAASHVSFAFSKVEVIDETEHGRNDYRYRDIPTDSSVDSVGCFVDSRTDDSGADLVVKIVEENVFYDFDVLELRSKPSIEAFDNEMKFIKRCQKCCRARVLDDFTWDEVPKQDKIELMGIILGQPSSKMLVTKEVRSGATCCTDSYHDI